MRLYFVFIKSCNEEGPNVPSCIHRDQLPGVLRNLPISFCWKGWMDGWMDGRMDMNYRILNQHTSTSTLQNAEKPLPRYNGNYKRALSPSIVSSTMGNSFFHVLDLVDKTVTLSCYSQYYLRVAQRSSRAVLHQYCTVRCICIAKSGARERETGYGKKKS